MNENPDINQLKRIIEGALFAANEPLNVDKLLALFEESETPERKDMQEALALLQQDYSERGIELCDLSSGYQFQVRADLSSWIRKLWQERPARYSRALMETLALVAYKQPITRAEIEQIRGVAVSTQIVKTLEEHGWIRTVGHKDVPGRPELLATTKQFLDHFGMKSLSELPPLDSLRDLELMGQNLQQELDLQASEESKIGEIALDTSPLEGEVATHSVADEG
jgi:segregation and condensation protein B